MYKIFTIIVLISFALSLDLSNEYGRKPINQVRKIQLVQKHKEKVLEFNKFDKNKDQELSREEFQEYLLEQEQKDLFGDVLDQFDVDKSNTLSLKEYLKWIFMLDNDFDILDDGIDIIDANDFKQEKLNTEETGITNDYIDDILDPYDGFIIDQDL